MNKTIIFDFNELTENDFNKLLNQTRNEIKTYLLQFPISKIYNEYNKKFNIKVIHPKKIKKAIREASSSNDLDLLEKEYKEKRKFEYNNLGKVKWLNHTILEEIYDEEIKRNIPKLLISEFNEFIKSKMHTTIYDRGGNIQSLIDFYKLSQKNRLNKY